MPYIDIHTGVTLSKEAREEITREMGRLIAIIPGKNVGNLMLAYHDEVPMALNGAEGNFLFMDLRLFRTAAADQKKAVVEGCFPVFEKVLGIPPANVYINVIELPNWGSKGRWD